MRLGVLFSASREAAKYFYSLPVLYHIYSKGVLKLMINSMDIPQVATDYLPLLSAFYAGELRCLFFLFLMFLLRLCVSFFLFHTKPPGYFITSFILLLQYSSLKRTKKKKQAQKVYSVWILLEPVSCFDFAGDCLTPGGWSWYDFPPVKKGEVVLRAGMPGVG